MQTIFVSGSGLMSAIPEERINYKSHSVLRDTGTGGEKERERVSDGQTKRERERGREGRVRSASRSITVQLSVRITTELSKFADIARKQFDPVS